MSTAECRDEGIQRYPKVSPESDPTSCIPCCSLTAVGGSKNGVKPELARLKSEVAGKKRRNGRLKGKGGLVVTANGRPWNPGDCQITTTDLVLSKTNTKGDKGLRLTCSNRQLIECRFVRPVLDNHAQTHKL